MTKLSKQTIIRKVSQGLYENQCRVVGKAHNTDVMKPLFEYLKKKGIELGE